MSQHSTLLFKANLCRLCFNIYEDYNLTNIYDPDNGIDKKIRKYLSLSVNAWDHFPKSICWHCSMALESFHKFSEKVGEINERLIKENFASVAEQVVYRIESATESEIVMIANPSKKEDTKLVLVTEETPVKIQLPENETPSRQTRSKTSKSPKTSTTPTTRKRALRKSGDEIIEPIQVDEAAAEGNPQQKIKMENLDMSDDQNEVASAASESDDELSSNTFPSKLLKDGKLQIKGKPLLKLVCRFYKLKCDLCVDNNALPKFTSINQLFGHYKDAHDGIEGYVTCCQNKYSHYPAIINHMCSHLQPEAFTCSICNYTVSRPRFLKSHMDTHKMDADKPFHCDQCDKKFCWKAALDIHLEKHQPEETRKSYVCHECGKRYDSPGGLSTHKRQNHSSQPKPKETNVCHLCAKTFATRSNMLEHLASIHRPREENQIQCPECNKWLMNRRCLKSHMLLHSDIEMKCSECEYVTKKKHLLERHTITHHSKERPFVCELCQKSFKLKRALTVHLNQHNQKTLYSCDFCDRTFGSSTNYYSHRKNMHPEELKALRDQVDNQQRLKRVCAGIEKLDESMTIIVDRVEPGEVTEAGTVLIASC